MDVIQDVIGVIVADEAVAQRGRERGEDCRGQQQADEYWRLEALPRLILAESASPSGVSFHNVKYSRM